MDPSAIYRVPTRAVEAEIEIEGGRREEVTFYLTNVAETHEGAETMAEALNRPRQFVPDPLDHADFEETGDGYDERQFVRSGEAGTGGAQGSLDEVVRQDRSHRTLPEQRHNRRLRRGVTLRPQPRRVLKPPDASGVSFRCH